MGSLALPTNTCPGCDARDENIIKPLAAAVDAKDTLIGILAKEVDRLTLQVIKLREEAGPRPGPKPRKSRSRSIIQKQLGRTRAERKANFRNG